MDSSWVDVYAEVQDMANTPHVGPEVANDDDDDDNYQHCCHRYCFFLYTQYSSYQLDSSYYPSLYFYLYYSCYTLLLEGITYKCTSMG